MQQPDLDDLTAQFIEALESVAPHRRVQADAELARYRWLKRHRGVPSNVLYDRETGEPRDRELRDLEAAIHKARSDVDWCRAVVVAAAEAHKGESFDDVLARNEANRHRLVDRRAQLTGGPG